MNFCPVFYTAAPKCVCIRRMAGARQISPVVLWTLWPEGGSEPLTSAPRSEFMAQSLVLSIDVCPGLGISPLQTFGWVFLRPILAGPGIILFGDFEKLETFFPKICAHSERYRNLLAGIFEILTFYGTSRFHCHRSYSRDGLNNVFFWLGETKYLNNYVFARLPLIILFLD